MKSEKKKSVSMANQRKIYLRVGFIASISMVLVAFEWNFKDGPIMVDPFPADYAVEAGFPPITIPEPVPVTERKPEPPRTTRRDVEIKIVKDTKVVKETKNTNPLDDFEKEIHVETATEEIDTTILSFVDFPAQPRIGMNNFRNNIAQCVSRNLSALDKRKLGKKPKLYMSFVVETDGSISGIKIDGAPGIGKYMEQAIQNTVKQSGKWTPAQHEGRERRQRTGVPINIKINGQ